MARGQHRRPRAAGAAGAGRRPSPRRPPEPCRAGGAARPPAADPHQPLGPRRRWPAPLVPPPRRRGLGRPAWRRAGRQDPQRLRAAAALAPPPGRGSVAERFNTTMTWADVLAPHGWSCPDPDPDADGARWRHPGASNPKSATIRHGLLFVYSQATPFQPTEAGAPHGYSKFRAFAVLEHA